MARAGKKKPPHNANGRLIIQERPFARGALFPRGPSVVTSAPTALACDYATFPAGPPPPPGAGGGGGGGAPAALACASAPSPAGPSGAWGAVRVAGAGTAGVALAGGVGAACHAGWM